MHPDDALGCGDGRGDLGHRQRGGVRGEHGVGPHDPLELREQLQLGVEIFDDRLDHEVAAGQLAELGRQP